MIVVEDLDMKAMSRCLHLGKGVMDSIIRFEAPQQKKLIRAITEAEGN